MIKSEFFIQLIGASFFLILNIYLAKKGFSDAEIANFISYRFLAVMLLAFPLGFYIRGKPLKPFFILGSVGVPFIAIFLVLAVENICYQYLPFLFILWGIAFTLFQVSSLPYIMRNTIPKNQSHAISLNYATHSFGTILSGIIIFGFGNYMQKINEGIPALIMVRDIDPDAKNPFTTEQTVEMIKKYHEAHGHDVKVVVIPDIESVNFGRGVGYEINEFTPPPNIGWISATK